MTKLSDPAIPLIESADLSDDDLLYLVDQTGLGPATRKTTVGLLREAGMSDSVALVSGVASAGVAPDASRVDHVHPAGPAVLGDHTAATLTLAPSDRNTHRALDASSNAIAIEIPNTLPVGWFCHLRVADITAGITISTGAGLITPTYYGVNAISAVDTLIDILVESSSVALVTIAEPV